MAAHSPETDEDDPIVAEYDVYITPENDDNLYLLQYPDRERDKPYNERNQSAPTEMRIKPHTGFLEVDVGFGTGPNFYKQRAVAWGVALNTANESGLKEFGVASGFGKAARMNELSSAQRQPADEATIDDMVQDFDHHVQSGFVRPEQVFGGQIVRPEPRQPTYMLGAFRGSEFSDAYVITNGVEELHLKRLEGVVQMRPQYHHIDAKRQLAKATSARGTESVKLNEPRLIQQTAKTAADGEEMSIAKTSEYLTKASEEQWLRLRHKDEDVSLYLLLCSETKYPVGGGVPGIWRVDILAGHELCDAAQVPLDKRSVSR